MDRFCPVRLLVAKSADKWGRSSEQNSGAGLAFAVIGFGCGAVAVFGLLEPAVYRVSAERSDWKRQRSQAVPVGFFEPAADGAPVAGPSLGSRFRVFVRTTPLKLD